MQYPPVSDFPFVRQLKTQKSDTLEGLTITATISFDRQKAMNDIMSGSENGGLSEGGRPSFDRDKFAGFMGESSSLTLDEYKNMPRLNR